LAASSYQVPLCRRRPSELIALIRHDPLSIALMLANKEMSGAPYVEFGDHHPVQYP
jgi:hypothetical protein